MIARDYVDIESDAGVAALADGGTLEVAFIGYRADRIPGATFRSAWSIPPGTIS